MWVRAAIFCEPILMTKVSLGVLGALVANWVCGKSEIRNPKYEIGE
jgi:hypothetical protein